MLYNVNPTSTHSLPYRHSRIRSNLLLTNPRHVPGIMSIYYLDIYYGSVRRCNLDGTGEEYLAENQDSPDGVQVDTRPDQGWVYWTSMGKKPTEVDGFLSRCRLDGSDRQVIVKVGATMTPKQLHLDREYNQLYWCDREGKAIYRCSLDGSNQQKLYESVELHKGEDDHCQHNVGIAIDYNNGYLYWSQKGPPKGGKGRILRAPLDRKPDAPSKFLEAEVVFDYLPEPIDLEIDEKSEFLFWTDRGDVPHGNTLNRWPIADIGKKSAAPGETAIAHRLHEGIGLVLDEKNRHVFAADILGSLYRFDWDGKNKKVILEDAGHLSGICLSD